MDAISELTKHPPSPFQTPRGKHKSSSGTSRYCVFSTAHPTPVFRRFCGYMSTQQLWPLFLFTCEESEYLIHAEATRGVSWIPFLSPLHKVRRRSLCDSRSTLKNILICTISIPSRAANCHAGLPASSDTNPISPVCT